MNLYLISQDINDRLNTYDSAVVCAESEDEARLICPDGRQNWDGKTDAWDCWAEAEHVDVALIGTAANKVDRGIVCASFNAA